MVHMPKNPPDSICSGLRQRLNARARERWPELTRVEVRYRGGFAYVDAVLPDGEIRKLCRLRFGGILHTWGFALYVAGDESYQENTLPGGLPAGSPEEALDCAGDLYLNALAPAI